MNKHVREAILAKCSRYADEYPRFRHIAAVSRDNEPFDEMRAANAIYDLQGDDVHPILVLQLNVFGKKAIAAYINDD